MHVSVLCRPELFSAAQQDQPRAVEDMLPGWTRYDRLGVVVNEPMGLVGASVMIQLATALFYTAEPARRQDQYPPLFVFHAGDRYGDYSALDVWPPRREVFLRHGPYELLGALRDRSITRLLLPESTAVQIGAESDTPAGNHHNPPWVADAPSGWTDAASFREQLATAYLYSPRGTVQHADISLSTADPDCEAMVEDVLAPHQCYHHFARRDDESLLAMGAGPSTVTDLRLWLSRLRTRLDEVDGSIRTDLLRRRRQLSTTGAITQTYRSLTSEEALWALGRTS